MCVCVCGWGRMCVCRAWMGWDGILWVVAEGAPKTDDLIEKKRKEKGTASFWLVTL